MKKFRSALALILVACMSLMLLTACGPSIQVQSDGSASGGNNQSAAPAASDNTAAPAAEGEGAPEAAPAGELTYAPGTTLRMATGYNSTKTGLSFDAETAGEGITLADGNTYTADHTTGTWNRE